MISKVKNKTIINKDFDFIEFFIKFLSLIAFIYLLILVSELFLFKKTKGELLFSVQSPRTETITKYSKYRGTYSYRYSYEIDSYSYTYNLNGKQYNGTVLTHMIIYPDIVKNAGSIDVYYNRLFPNVSVMLLITPKYFIYNSIPLLLLLIPLAYYWKRNKVRK